MELAIMLCVFWQTLWHISLSNKVQLQVLWPFSTSRCTRTQCVSTGTGCHKPCETLSMHHPIILNCYSHIMVFWCNDQWPLPEVRPVWGPNELINRLPLTCGSSHYVNRCSLISLDHWQPKRRVTWCTSIDIWAMTLKPTEGYDLSSDVYIVTLRRTLCL